jgi:cell division protein FtsX
MSSYEQAALRPSPAAAVVSVAIILVLSCCFMQGVMFIGNVAAQLASKYAA